MRILCTNDDGIHAEGLAVLERIARALSDDVWVIAPESEQSGASRSLTLTEPIRVREAGRRRYAISGTPTDCVLLGVHDLMPDRRPDLVLSGVNHGQNIADDVTFSGTIAGAMQGMQLGVPSIALSQAKGFRGPETPVSFLNAETFGAAIVSGLVQRRWPAHVVMNVNFPDCDPGEVTRIELTRQGHRDERIVTTEQRTDLRGNAYFWIGFRGQRSNPAPGTDLKAVYERAISVTPLHVDLTHDETLAVLRGLFEGALDGGG